MEDPSRLNQGLTTSWPAPRYCAHRLPEPPNLSKHILLRVSDFFFRCRTNYNFVDFMRRIHGNEASLALESVQHRCISWSERGDGRSQDCEGTDPAEQFGCKPY